jgi:hypothetical protein
MTSGNEQQQPNEAQQQPNKADFDFYLTAAKIRELVEVAEVAEWHELCKLEELDEQAQHINARVFPSGGRNYTVCVGAYFIQNGLSVLSGMMITIHEDNLRMVYEGQLISQGGVDKDK